MGKGLAIANITLMRTLQAYTLLELMLVVSLVAILAAFAIPSFNNFIQRSRAETQINQLISAIHYARLNAITHQQKITLCMSNDEISCGGQWSDGQIILNQDKKILQKFPVLGSGISLNWQSSGQNRNTYLEFLPTGFTNGQKGSFYYCNLRDHQYSQRIVIENTGRTRLEEISSVDYLKYCKTSAGS